MKQYSGNEPLILSGKALPYTIKNFWQIELSYLILNMTRGSFAEFLVRCALKEGGFDTLSVVKAGVEPFDIVGPQIHTPTGSRPCRIEVKSAASVQRDTPDEKEPISLAPSRIVFSIQEKVDFNKPKKEQKRMRNNDLYVFCHYTATHKSDNILDLNFWDFYVYPTFKINENTDTKLSEQHTISLKRLQQIGVCKRDFSELYGEIQKAIAEITYHNQKTEKEELI